MTEFVPRVAFVTAEHHVDYVRILTHIDTRRATVERAVAPTARKIGYSVIQIPGRPSTLIDVLTKRLEVTLMRTARFGYAEARSELGRLRVVKPLPAVTAAYQFPDAGRHGVIAKGGLDAIKALVRRRAHQTAGFVYEAAHVSAQSTDTNLPAAVRVAAAAGAATRALHASVLELVGETLNLGRTAGVLSLPQPPEYAMRSEQLDANTCDPCDEVHGTIVEIGSDDYFDILPPSYCLGGGRCRGIMVYGDSAADVTQQLAA